jgi:predicted ATPase
MGQVSEGLRIVGDALAATRKTGERFWEAESYRIKGELLLRQSTERDSTGSASRKTALGPEPSVLSAAAECFHQAVDVAQRQQAKSLELRATVSLCRLWQEQGRTEEASLRLAEVYEWFTEGFDTRDLEEAKALLSALA